MKIIYLGAEVPSNRLLLESTTANHVGVSFWRLMKRGLPKKSDYLLENYFSKDSYIYVHPGIPKGTRLDRLDLEVFAAEYEGFIANNIDRLTSFTEINNDWVDQDFVDNQRKTAWAEVPPGKFQPVWNPQTSLRGLKKLVDTYLDIAIPGDAIEADSMLASATRAHAVQDGTRFHALGCAKPDNLRQVRVETASTLSWLSPMMHGETIIWDGSRLVRYPKKMKDQARMRYNHIYSNAGLDADKILEDDDQEVCRLAVWSYEQFEMRMNKMINEPDDELLYDNSEGSEVEGSGETTPLVADNRGVQMRKLEPRNPEEMGNLPVFGYTNKTVVEQDEEGNDVIKDVTILESQSTSLRACDTCFVASNCPAFKPQSVCAFKLPVEVKTTEQVKGLLNAIIEMQGQRVAFMRFAEEMNGGYADPNLSQEIDRLYNLIGKLNDMGSSKEFIRMTVEKSGSAGVLSAIFGDKAQALRELPNGGLNEVQTTEIIRQSLEDK
jgi:hypothetical protein